MGMGMFKRLVGVSLSFSLLTACGSSTPSSSDKNNPSAAGADSGGAGSMLGGGGSGAEPAGVGGGSSNIGAQQSSDKLDVLFVIDNSLSMAGKQKILIDSIPAFVGRLTNPRCVDLERMPTPEQPPNGAALCASGTREFSPIRDIHFGVITTSLGSQGGMVCSLGASAHNDDQGQLVPSKRVGVASYQGSGYLAFDATGNAGVADASLVATDLRAHIQAAGEDGCGYEAPLEAMYRFLVDPEPPVSVQVENLQSTAMGINDVLLKQRNSFLRPDSSLAILMLSDENDCSIIDTQQGFLVGAYNSGSMANADLPRASSACDVNPNDPCCRSCAANELTRPSGCPPLSDDSVCKNIQPGKTSAVWDVLHDSLNVRCFDQKRRFGFDFLNPIERYTKALSARQISNRSGVLVDNPLLAARDGKGPRSPTLISVGMIVGAPWQDLATPASLSGAALEYLDAAGLQSSGRWSLLIGDRALGTPPTDSFMVESIAPRTGQNPLTQFNIMPATSTDPMANPINGHEQNTPDLSDLQYACTFPLATPVVCAPGDTCECSADRQGNTMALLTANSPLCQPPAGGQAGTTQYFGKGYPGTRELIFAQALGARAVVGSICPKQQSNPASAEYAYRPALDALIRRISTTLK